MSRKAGRRTCVVIPVLVIGLALSRAALAAGSLAPRLVSPNHKKVAAGTIKLDMDIPGNPIKNGVFIDILPSRTLSHGVLKTCRGVRRCDFVQAKSHVGHRWTYVAPAYTFAGWWAITPGRYYWQVHYYTTRNVYYSAIGSFTVK
jgi:hypothetical protein